MSGVPAEIIWPIVVPIAVFILLIVGSLVLARALGRRYRGPEERTKRAASVDEAEMQAAGRDGEYSVSRILKRLDDPKYIIDDYCVSDGDVSFQVDHILICRSGVFVIETKNWSGDIYGDENDKEWCQYKHWYATRRDRRTEKRMRENPIKQNSRHIYKLRKIVEGAYFNNVVVMTQNNVEHITADNVVPLDGLTKYIRSFDKTALTDREMNRIYSALMDYAKEHSITEEEHVRLVSDLAERTRTALEQGICPRCGSKLRLVHGKYGDFYGCKSYPRCNFRCNVESVPPKD